jgi:glucosamine--fructose-6-phosphate aminotransferase (isomerizing)
VEKSYRVKKGALTLSRLLKRDDMRREIRRYAAATSSQVSSGEARSFAAMGHSRLVTNGTQLKDDNNQPVIKDGVIAVHNGIIVNEREIWSRHPELHRSYEIDTEIMLALVRKYLVAGRGVENSIGTSLREVFGTVAAALFIDDLDKFALATNNGSLYFASEPGKLFAFASEQYFVDAAIRKQDSRRIARSTKSRRALAPL